MPFRNGNKVWNVTDWTEERIAFLKANFYSMTNPQIAKALGLGLTTVRTQCYRLGLKRMELEYWTDKQIIFLIKNYKKIGDVELAEIFNKKWYKEKGWTNKHIEKKRRYLKLKRTDAEKEAIQQRNVDNGRFLMCPVKRWATTGQAKEGEIRMWREQSGRFVPRIKTNGRFIHWNRWAWEQNYGPIPEGMSVCFKDDDPTNMDPDNLILLTRAEHAIRNVAKSGQALSDNYVAGIMSFKDRELRKLLIEDKSLIEVKRQQIILQRKIKQYDSARN